MKICQFKVYPNMTLTMVLRLNIFDRNLLNMIGRKTSLISCSLSLYPAKRCRFFLYLKVLLILCVYIKKDHTRRTVMNYVEYINRII